MASVLGDEAGALLIDCRFEAARVVPFSDRGVSVLICNTNVKHALADGAYARRRTAVHRGGPPARRAEPRATRPPAMVEAGARDLDPVVRRRARHVATENVRTLAAAARSRPASSARSAP